MTWDIITAETFESCGRARGIRNSDGSVPDGTIYAGTSRADMDRQFGTGTYDAMVTQASSASEIAQLSPDRIKLPVVLAPDDHNWGFYVLLDGTGDLVASHLTAAEANHIADQLNAEPVLRELVKWAVRDATLYPNDASAAEFGQRDAILARLPESWRAGK